MSVFFQPNNEVFEAHARPLSVEKILSFSEVVSLQNIRCQTRLLSTVDDTTIVVVAAVVRSPVCFLSETVYGEDARET